jgi:hypothetical protein
MADRRYIQALIEQLDSPDEIEYRTAVFDLADLKDEAAAFSFDALKDKRPRVRKGAACALGKIPTVCRTPPRPSSRSGMLDFRGRRQLDSREGNVLQAPVLECLTSREEE